jgi:hypothetical protein
VSVLRVTVLDAWDEVTLPRHADQTLADLKRTALKAARIADDPAAFVLKYLGAELRDESATVGTAGLPENAALIALRRRRRAVR